MKTLLWILLLLVGNVVALFFLVAVDVRREPAYDQSDPYYHRYLEAFERLRVQLDERGTTKEDFVDFSKLNNGEWKTACLFGGYTNPLHNMQALGAHISEKDEVRMTEAGSMGLRLAQVEEYEIAIAFVDVSNNAHFIHFKDGIGPEGKRFAKCISRPETRLFLMPPR